MEQFWKIKHDFWMEDFRFEIKQQEEIKSLLMKHPEDDIGNIFRDILKHLDKKYKFLLRNYKKVYGGNPPGLIILRRETAERILNGNTSPKESISSF